MAVRTPSGNTLLGNLSIIPSEQKWVIHALYQHAFPHLYSSEVCFRNRLVLTDEDEAEYRSFESILQVISDAVHISWNLDGIQEGPNYSC